MDREATLANGKTSIWQHPVLPFLDPDRPRNPALFDVLQLAYCSGVAFLGGNNFGNDLYTITAIDVKNVVMLCWSNKCSRVL